MGSFLGRLWYGEEVWTAMEEIALLGVVPSYEYVEPELNPCHDLIHLPDEPEHSEDWLHQHWFVVALTLLLALTLVVKKWVYGHDKKPTSVAGGCPVTPKAGGDEEQLMEQEAILGYETPRLLSLEQKMEEQERQFEKTMECKKEQIHSLEQKVEDLERQNEETLECNTELKMKCLKLSTSEANIKNMYKQCMTEVSNIKIRTLKQTTDLENEAQQIQRDLEKREIEIIKLKSENNELNTQCQKLTEREEAMESTHEKHMTEVTTMKVKILNEKKILERTANQFQGHLLQIEEKLKVESENLNREKVLLCQAQAELEHREKRVQDTMAVLKVEKEELDNTKRELCAAKQQVNLAKSAQESKGKSTAELRTELQEAIKNFTEEKREFDKEKREFDKEKRDQREKFQAQMESLAKKKMDFENTKKEDMKFIKDQLEDLMKLKNNVSAEKNEYCDEYYQHKKQLVNEQREKKMREELDAMKINLEEEKRNLVAERKEALMILSHEKTVLQEQEYKQASYSQTLHAKEQDLAKLEGRIQEEKWACDNKQKSLQEMDRSLQNLKTYLDGQMEHFQVLYSDYEKEKLVMEQMSLAQAEEKRQLELFKQQLIDHESQLINEHSHLQNLKTQTTNDKRACQEEIVKICHERKALEEQHNQFQLNKVVIQQQYQQFQRAQHQAQLHEKTLQDMTLQLEREKARLEENAKSSQIEVAPLSLETNDGKNSNKDEWVKFSNETHELREYIKTLEVGLKESHEQQLSGEEYSADDNGGDTQALETQHPVDSVNNIHNSPQSLQQQQDCADNCVKMQPVYQTEIPAQNVNNAQRQEQQQPEKMEIEQVSVATQQHTAAAVTERDQMKSNNKPATAKRTYEEFSQDEVASEQQQHTLPSKRQRDTINEKPFDLRSKLQTKGEAETYPKTIDANRRNHLDLRSKLQKKNGRGGGELQNIEIEKHLHKVIVGKGGRTIKYLKNHHGVDIKVPDLNGTQTTVQIVGEAASVQAAIKNIYIIIQRIGQKNEMPHHNNTRETTATPAGGAGAPTRRQHHPFNGWFKRGNRNFRKGY